ncbi:MAG: hypothetical protein ACJ702_07675, partial [Nitrososphaeraceae archaeon]
KNDEIDTREVILALVHFRTLIVAHALLFQLEIIKTRIRYILKFVERTTIYNTGDHGITH